MQTARWQLLQCNTVLAQVDEALASYRTGGAVHLLQSIPGFGPLTAQAYLAALGDWSRFPNPEHAASYLGLVPSIRASGSKERRGHITKEGPSYVRWLLVQAALTTGRKLPCKLVAPKARRRSNRNGQQVQHLIAASEPATYGQLRLGL